MRLLIIRHGDPDYERNSLTEKGRREAEYLADFLCGQDIDYFYTSPYGRARETAAPVLARLGRTAEELPWLREFDYLIDRPDDKEKMRISWDWLPQDWTREPLFYDKDKWRESEFMAPFGIGEEYDKVVEGFDELLAKHGYRREGGYYRAERPNHETIAMFCHFGSGSVLLSHLWGVSPMVVWHGFCAQPSSVTTVVTEERREGIASFRMLSYGETTHLYAHDEPPAFAARFCECWTDETRHD